MNLSDLPQDMMYDFALGYVRANKANGFDVLGNDASPNGRIVTLGCGDWPIPLFYELNDEYQIYNGCTPGYTSAQCMLMLIRDCILLEPKKIICVCGYFNFAYSLGIGVSAKDEEILKSHPFVTPNHIKYYTFLTERKGLGNTEIYYGEDTNVPAYKTWLSDLKAMNAICDEFEIDFHAFLQPNPGTQNPLLNEYYKKATELIKPFINFHTLNDTKNSARIAQNIRRVVWKD
ncbi:MAG: hypothetical protein LBS21_06105 [Clostridiales bacterium]|jgi:hypothetical protein|nr:hypothetical protein [Clostridiales bacterium]